MTTDTTPNILDNKCPFCGSDKVNKIWKAFDADEACLNCGAIFYSRDHLDPEKRGKFTGKREPIPHENMYKLMGPDSYKQDNTNKEE